MLKSNLWKVKSKYKIILSEIYVNPNTKPKETYRVVESFNNWKVVIAYQQELIHKLEGQVKAEVSNPFHYVYKLKINQRTAVKYEKTFDLKERLIL